ncbi:uncharacterized protein JCM6883_002075 [Sporobolomyces salmoneus]|uniref:uncharacterized protein n=1 Tax=Sporobolomyces salmoneus TaxID=183962 RepID=UPI0031709862
MADSQVCPSCEAHNTLELDHASGTLACTRCGTVSTESSTAVFEFLARVDEEDEFANGRVYVSDRATAARGGIAANGIRGLGGKATQYAAGIGERASMYHAKKRKAHEDLMKRMLNLFDAKSVLRRAVYLFETMKKKVGFTWGYRAIVFTAACVYVAIREQPDREVWIHNLMDCNEDIKETIHLARAIRLVKLEYEIHTTDREPILFIERALVHLQKVFQSSTPTYHIGDKKTKRFAAKNRTWITGLSLERARTLAVSLLSFSRSLHLSFGRAPEQAACAAVMVALEAIARKPCPKQQEFDDEMAWLTNTAAFTIQERYREYQKALTTFAPQVPWIANQAKKWKKKEVVEHTTDIVQYWSAIDAKEKKDEKLKKEAEDRARAQPGGVSAEPQEEEEDEEDAETRGGAGSDDDDEEEESVEALSPNFGFADPLATQTDVYGFSDEPGGGNQGHRGKPGNPSRRPGVFVRGSVEWNRHRAAQEALSKGLGPSPSPAPGPLDAASPSPPTLSTKPLDASPDPETPISSLPPSTYATLATYGQKPEATRAQLAPGAPTTKSKSKRPKSRLDELLWEKTVDEIDDDELFDDGELDSYLRTEEETNAVRRLPEYSEMVIASVEKESKPRQPNRPRRRVRGQLNPEYIQLQKEAAEKGTTMNQLSIARGKRERGEEESEEDSTPVVRRGPFLSRIKKTKVNHEAADRLLAAQESEDEEGEEGWVADAIHEASRVDPGVVGVEVEGDEGEEGGDGSGDEGDYLGEELGDGDWRKEFPTGEVDSDGYEDE